MRKAILPILLLMLGCEDRQSEIRSYTVPKEAPPMSAASAAASDAPALPTGDMQWSLPPGWVAAENAVAMRFATIRTADSPEAVEVAVTQHGGAAGGIAANINRWRGQVGLAPADQDELTRTVQPIAAHGARGLLVDLIGPPGADDPTSPRMLAAIFPAEQNTWFIKATANNEVIDGILDGFLQLCHSVTFSGSPRPIETAPPPPTSPPASAVPARPQIAWGTLPDGWTVDAPPRPMAVASFTIGPDTAMTVTPLGGPQDLLANINRWCRQIGAPVQTSLEDNPPRAIDLGGTAGHLVDVAGPERRTIGAVLVRAGTTWFYKLTGPNEVVEKHAGAFEAFIDTIQLPEDRRE